MGKLEILVNGEATFTSEDTTELSITGSTGAVALVEIPNDEKTILNLRSNGTLQGVTDAEVEEAEETGDDGSDENPPDENTISSGFTV